MSKRQVAVIVMLGLIILLAAFLRLYQLGSYSIGNAYYAATVQSMLTSWHNFFYASFEPGGSVTVDKPPLGLWVQAAFAYVLGVNGFALALPQALAGVLSIPLLYSMVRRQFGQWAGLIASLALAVVPVAVSTERNNTMDGLLVCVLLLATWAFLKSVRERRPAFLFLGTFLIGLGFNIKMLQAFMPLPALYALYLLGARYPWWKRFLHLTGATLLLLVISLSWAIAVDLTPPEERPYIGSSTDNTVMELVIGHNGLRRLGLQQLLASSDDGPSGQGRDNLPAPGGGQPGQQPPEAPQRPGEGPAYPPPPGGSQPGPMPPRAPGQGPGNTSPQTGPGGASPVRPQGAGFNQEVGEAGWLRLFSEPLVSEASWLLPLALLGLPLVLLVLGWQWPLGEKHLALVLWAGWLLPELLYFTLNTGLFHAYYLIMLGPPLAALVGITAWALWRVCQRRSRPGWALLALLAGGTLAFQLFTLRSYPGYAIGVAAAAVPLLAAGLGLLSTRPGGLWAGRVALTLALLSTMIAPLLWSSLTTLDTNPDVWLPRSGTRTLDANHTTALTASQEALADYLLANTDPDSYLLATLNARQAAPYILATLRPVLTFGGFSGSDDVVDVETLSGMVATGELCFVLGGQDLARQKPELANWLERSCTVVHLPGLTNGGQPDGGQVLYDCGGYNQAGLGGDQVFGFASASRVPNLP